MNKSKLMGKGKVGQTKNDAGLELVYNDPVNDKKDENEDLNNKLNKNKKDKKQSKKDNKKKKDKLRKKSKLTRIGNVKSIGDFQLSKNQSRGFLHLKNKKLKNIEIGQNINEMPTRNELLGLDEKGKEVNEQIKPFDIEVFKEDNLKELGFSNKNEWEDIEFYQVQENYSYVDIIKNLDSHDKLYLLLENKLNKREEKIFNFIKNTLSKYSLDVDDFEIKGREQYLIEKADEIIQDYMINLHPVSKDKIIYYLKKIFIGFGKLEPLMKDPNIEDISCDGSESPVFLYHRTEGSLKSNVVFNDEDELSSFVVRLSQKCGKHISIANPMLDATMPDGSRIQMTLSDEVTTKGSTFTIRKFKEDPLSPADLIKFKTMSSEMVSYMWMAVEYGANALIAGGTAAGKTSLLNAIASFIPRESKIVSIEETREINLPHNNWIPGIARSGFGEIVGDKIVGEIDLYDLMKAALRQRPEYIIVGEIRGREAYVLFQAMATGHTTYSTVHADSAKSLIHRLEGKPINIPRIMLQALDIVCIQAISRVANKRVRRTKQIIEIIDIDPETKEILTNEVFHWNPVDDTFVYSGKSYILEHIRVEKNLSHKEITDELRNRALLMEWINEKEIKGFNNVASWTAKYIDNPSDVMKKIQNINQD